MRFWAGFLPRGAGVRPSRRVFARYEKENGTRRKAKRISHAVLYCDYTAKCTYTHAVRAHFGQPAAPIRRRAGRQEGKLSARTCREPPRYPHGRRGGGTSDKTNSKTGNGKQRHPVKGEQLSYTQLDYTTKTILRMKNILCAFNTAPRSARLRLGGIKARGGASRLSSGGLPPLAAADLCTAKIGIKRLSAK